MQNLLNDLKELLQSDERLVVDGKLLKNKIIELGLQLDPSLIKTLLSNASIKKHFFQEVDTILVFDKVKFQKFVSNKAFLPDSYTSYKNKIGLTVNDDYISEAKEVVLSFPYKDCFLEGGQTKEEASRKEIFWNQILAPDEIDRLLSPKVLTAFKKYDKDGAHSVTELPDNFNLIIKGNNLLALHSLKKRFENQVGLIYIDPPFNTNNDSFQYNDSFKHSTWLTFMKNRLEVAHTLLKADGGCIMVHIDDIEMHYIKILMDEIFDRDNFIATIAVKSSTPSGVKTAHKDTSIIKQKDFILFYKKGGTLKLNPQYTKRTDWDPHYSLWLETADKDSFSLTKLVDKLIVAGVIEKGKKLEDLSLNDTKFRNFYIENADRIIRLQSHKNKEVDKISRTFPNTVYKHIIDGKVVGLYYNGQVITPLKQGIKKVYYDQKFTNDLGLLVCDFWEDVDFQNTQNEGGISFPTAKKPEFLLNRIIDLTTREGDIVLDYHLGSGTTAAVAHKMKRRYIGIEQMDYGQNDCTVRLQNVIKGEQSGISKALSFKGGGEFIYCELMKLNERYVHGLENIKTKEELLDYISDILNSHSLSYQFNQQVFHDSKNAFNDLTLDEQKNFFHDILDKNMLYVPLSEMSDKDHAVSDLDKLINQKFYRL